MVPTCGENCYYCQNCIVPWNLKCSLEAIEVSSVSIQKASKLISQRSSPMDGQLFLIAPFDIEFLVTHKELDFSHLLDHLRRILRGQASLFDWSRLTSLARTLSPRVLESQRDAKKVLTRVQRH